MLRRLFLFILTGILYLNGSAQSKSSSEIIHELQKLQFNGKVLYIAAHPDDENTRLIAWLTNDLKADVAYLSLTRGDGGQNLIGKEIGEGLGLLRSHELLAARGIDGGEQYFSRAIDFGYSKTPKETYEFWNKEQVLSDMVKVIRTIQPDIIITRFSEVENPKRPTHGHHTASAQLAREAMVAAKDPNMFKHQLKSLSIWDVKRLYWNTSWWFYGSRDLMEEKVNEKPEEYLKIDVNSYLPLLGMHCSEISAMSRSQHKSQGFGSSPVVGDQIEYLQWMSGSKGKEDLFSGIPTRWEEVDGGKAIATNLKKLLAQFDVNQPQKTIPSLFQLRKTVEGLEDKCKWKNSSIDRVNKVILMCLGIQIQAYSTVQKTHAGEEVEIKFAMDNPRGLDLSFSFEEGSFSGFEKKPPLNPELKNGKWSASQKVLIPRDAGKSQPYWLQGNKSLGSYHVDEKNVGLAMNRYPFYLNVELKVGENSLPVEVPVEYSTTDPVLGKVVQPLVVQPDVMLNPSSNVMIFPNTSSKSLQVHVIAGKSGMKGYVELNTPEGWKAEPAFYKCDLKDKGEEQLFDFKITPPSTADRGTIRAIFKTSTIYSTGVQSLDYEHVPELAWFPVSEFTVQRIDLTRRGSLLGYIPGAGDKVAEHLRIMGYKVDELNPDNITASQLSKYNAILVGIRAYNTVENIANINTTLNGYAKNGGTVIFQYNTAHRLKSKAIGPYDIKLSRGRVTEENAKVSFLAPEHKVLNSPNKISSVDFENWVQERGLYFPSEWSPEYTPILSMADEGSEQLRGSLLVAEYGKGHIVYTGISFFRELPAGVAGSYRLLANIVALGN